MSTTPKPKRTAEETLAALKREAAEDEMDRILALSDADLDAELSRAGFDPKAERSRGGPMGREAQRAAERLVPHEVREGDATAWTRPEPRPVQAPVLRPRFARPVFAVAAAAAVAGGIVVGVRWMTSRTEVALPSPPADAAPSSTAAPPRSAEELRRQAADACDQAFWAQCRNLLDTAAERDPPGEASPDVQTLRAKIRYGLGLGDAAPSDDKRPRRH